RQGATGDARQTRQSVRRRGDPVPRRAEEPGPARGRGRRRGAGRRLDRGRDLPGDRDGRLTRQGPAAVASKCPVGRISVPTRRITKMVARVPRRALLGGLLLALLAGVVPAAIGSTTVAAPSLQIKILSDRADLVSGGDALTEVVLPPGIAPGAVRVVLDSRDVTSAFAVRSDHRFEGLLTG